MAGSAITIRLGVQGNEEVVAALREISRSAETEFGKSASAATAVERSSAQLASTYGAVTRAAAMNTAAVNDNSGAMAGLSGVARDLGTAIIEHPVKATIALESGLRATSVGLGLAATAARGLAVEGAALGAATEVAASGLSAGAEAAAALASRLSLTVLATRLFSTAAGYALPILGPIGAGLTAFKLGAEAIEKAGSDLDKLVATGREMKALDVSSGLIDGFKHAGIAIRAVEADMQSALRSAATFVKDRPGEENAVSKLFNNLQSKGYGPVPATVQRGLDLDSSNETKIRAVLDGMKELEERGHRLMAIDVAGKVFGAALAEKLLLANTSAEEFNRLLDEAASKKLTDDAQAKASAELANNIERVKREIGEAWQQSIGFASVATVIDQAWLGILETTNKVVRGISDAVDTAGSKLKDWFNSDYWRAISKYMAYEGGQAAGDRNRTAMEPAGLADNPAGYEPKYEARRFPYMFGPDAPKATDAKGSSSSGGSGSERTASLDTYLKNIEKAAEVAKAEYETIGLGNQARERAVDLAKAQAEAALDFRNGLRESATLTDAETTRINAAADATVRWRDAAADMRSTISEINSDAKSVAHTFVDGMRAGKSATEALTDAYGKLLVKLQDRAIDDFIDAIIGGGKKGGGGFLDVLVKSMMSAFGLPSGGSGGLNFSGITDADFGFAGGGLVRGPGSGTSDSIHARLSDGEYVVRAAATARHRAILDQINGPGLRGFADGGYASVHPTAEGVAPEPVVTRRSPRAAPYIAAGPRAA